MVKRKLPMILRLIILNAIMVTIDVALAYMFGMVSGWIGTALSLGYMMSFSDFFMFSIVILGYANVMMIFGK